MWMTTMLTKFGRSEDRTYSHLALLSNKDFSDEPEGFEHASDKAPARWRECTHSWWHFSSMFLNVALLITVILLYAKVRQLSSPLPPWPATVYSPADKAVEYETVIFSSNLRADLKMEGKNIYMELSDAGDAAWEDLCEEYATSGIPPSQAALLPFHTVPAPNASDRYLIGLSVFHQLHCLNRVRMLLHPERYPWELAPNLSADETRIHDDHCVDLIRQALMCNADTSPIHWEWNERMGMALPSPETAHTCRKWERIMEWAADNKA